MDKQTVVYIMEQKSNKRKEQITDISNNMGESQKHHSELKKSDAKKYMLRCLFIWSPPRKVKLNMW